MTSNDPPASPTAEAGHILPAAHFDALLTLLHEDCFDVRGPRVQGGALEIGKLPNAAALPQGCSATQEPGAWRLQHTGTPAWFGITHGGMSWKALLHPARTRLWSAERTADGFSVHEDAGPAKPFAFIGVRACDLRAIAVQDNVLQRGPYVDAVYNARRNGAFLVTVDCAEPSGTCFCVSMGSGPAAGSGYDLALTELDAGSASHRFLVRTGSLAGEAVVQRLGLCEATHQDSASAKAIVEGASARMGRSMDATAARATLSANRESPHWQDVAQRCLSCGNCTMVCPTCFCTTVEDTSDLSGDIAERWRLWDSCFTFGFTHVAGGTVRESAGARYRHWISHKLLNLHEQFDESGCVGCGRCITWCPVGIDITAEVAALPQDVS